MKKLVTALFLILATAVWAGDFADGVAASNKGDYKSAFSLFKKAAERGISEAQFNVGLSYAIGKGVLQDYTEAVRWYKLPPCSSLPPLASASPAPQPNTTSLQVCGCR